jgi:uncharacterized protein with HEPN domain
VEAVLWRDDSYLLDIMIAARRTFEYMDGTNLDQFVNDKMRVDAVIRNLEIIGEASGKVSREFKKAYPEIPWEDMRGMRNRLVHEYFRVDHAKVWMTVKLEIPKIVDLIKPLVPTEDDN